MRFAITVSLGFLVAACGSSSYVDGAAGSVAVNTQELVCAPGRSVACVGPAGCSGGQVCDASGTKFAACICGTESGSGGGLAQSTGSVSRANATAPVSCQRVSAARAPFCLRQAQQAALSLL